MFIFNQRKHFFKVVCIHLNSLADPEGGWGFKLFDLYVNTPL